ncbi:hypothetical protein SAMN04488498_102270 [Mesorhizobium albiziae]|uniref:Uncharacterized protein n=1 Tax=Neomesorhizobium albiziae TaxID=335020 RepID=A0A1I3WJ83_9HYPH|nr:hypothetical protein SAMN04488498_102270 [Mesorhizobium albiziae]
MHIQFRMILNYAGDRRASMRQIKRGHHCSPDKIALATFRPARLPKQKACRAKVAQRFCDSHMRTIDHVKRGKRILGFPAL